MPTSPPLTDPIALAYLEHCARERTPENTLKRRKSVLRSLGNPGTATRDEVEAWWRSRGHLADSSRANELACLRSFYTWCQVWEHRQDNPTVRLAPPRAGAGSPTPLIRSHLDQVLEHLETIPEKRRGPLRRAVLLGAWAGLRVSEAAALSWSDIDPDTRWARVLGKGRKVRVVPFSAPLIAQLLPDTGGNVVTGRDRAWTADYLGGLVSAAFRDAGVDATFHKLRHRYGSIAYQRTKDPRALADVMGHSSVATTMSFYAKAADDAAAAIADAVVD